MKIGTTIESDIHIDDENITTIKIEVSKLKAEIKDILDKKKATDGEVAELEEKLRNLEGKVGCPSCGQVYEKKEGFIILF